MAKPKTYEEVHAILEDVDFEYEDLPPRTLKLIEKADNVYLLQVIYAEVDVDTKKPGVQKSRKWYISPFSTETEIVETAFKAIRTSMEHVLKEHFTYKGHRVYSPHLHINARLDVCEREAYDLREPPLERRAPRVERRGEG